MIDDKLLAEIRETHKNARFGYGSITSPVYVKHVGALLLELEKSTEMPPDVQDAIGAELGENQG